MTTKKTGNQQKTSDHKTRRFGPYTVNLTHLDKIMYRDDGLAKADILKYYERIATRMLPYLKNRPLTMERYPDGIEEKGFFHKQMPDYFPEWFQQTIIATEKENQKVPVCNNLASLLYVANQGSLTQHVWLSRKDLPDMPDQMVFDLDPPGNDFAPVRQAAIDTINILDELGLHSYVKTTGSRGLHIVVPLRRKSSFDEVRGFARDCAQLLIQRKPEKYTLEQRIADRGNRLYLDIQRNAYGQTIVAPYSLRAKPGAPIATPIAKKRLMDSRFHSRVYTIDNIFSHLAHTNDPWKQFKRHARTIDRARHRLNNLLDKET